MRGTGINGVKLKPDIIQYIRLGMGEGIVAEPPAIITSTGLGSCVALILYEKEKKIGGMAHIMLPDSKAVSHGPILPPFWFVDTAIHSLLNGILNKGAFLKNIVAKTAGGASMFPNYTGDSIHIGEQNIESINGILSAMHIPLAGWDTGGNHGRSAEFFLETGRVLIKAIGREDKEI
ncbi:MAG: chemotaxis protein CheD [Nitrospira sp.]|nr:chemotaxis protein CheD [Nitrospira sp.]